MEKVIAQWLTELADKTADSRKGKTGIIKLFLDSNFRRDSRNFHLSRLVAHCGGDAHVFCAAVGSLRIVPGTGDKAHIVLITDARYNRDAEVRKFTMAQNKAAQLEYLEKFMLAAGRFAEDLPAFNLPTETIQ